MVRAHGPSSWHFAPRPQVRCSTAHEHELQSWPIWSVPDVVDDQAAAGDAVLDLIATAEPQRRIRRHCFARAVEPVCPAEGHERKRDVENVHPTRDHSRTADISSAVCLLPVPRAPRLTPGIAHLEDHTSVGVDGAPDVTERSGERLVVEEHLSDVPRHRREVYRERRQNRGVAVDPPHPFCAPLPSGDFE